MCVYLIWRANTLQEKKGEGHTEAEESSQTSTCYTVGSRQKNSAPCAKIHLPASTSSPDGMAGKKDTTLKSRLFLEPARQNLFTEEDQTNSCSPLLPPPLPAGQSSGTIYWRLTHRQVELCAWWCMDMGLSITRTPLSHARRLPLELKRGRGVISSCYLSGQVSSSLRQKVSGNRKSEEGARRWGLQYPRMFCLQPPLNWEDGNSSNALLRQCTGKHPQINIPPRSTTVSHKFNEKHRYSEAF